MTSHLMDARALLAKAKDEYQRLLRQVDARLQAAVSQEPSRLQDAKALQAEYLTGFDLATFSEHIQPAGPVEPFGGRYVGPAIEKTPPVVESSLGQGDPSDHVYGRGDAGNDAPLGDGE